MTEMQIDEKMLTTSMKLPDKIRTAMIIPHSKETYSNTHWKAKEAPLCAYDMLFHPPDYNPKAARTDRQQPQIIRQNIWDQVIPIFISSKKGLIFNLLWLIVPITIITAFFHEAY